MGKPDAYSVVTPQPPVPTVPVPDTPPTTGDLKTIVQQLNQLLNILATLQAQFNAGQTTLTIEVLTVNNTADVLYANAKKVRGGFFMNLSTTDSITIAGGGSQAGRVSPCTAGAGMIMNPAAAAGQGGGTFNFGNIDISTLTAITSTNPAQSMAAVYYT